MNKTVLPKQLISRHVEFAVVPVDVIEIAPGPQDVPETGAMAAEQFRRCGKHHVALLAESRTRLAIVVFARDTLSVKVAVTIHLHNFGRRAIATGRKSRHAGRCRRSRHYGERLKLKGLPRSARGLLDVTDHR
jgi:hypothetical protein